MAELVTGLDPARVRANADEVRERIAAAARAAGRDPAGVQLVAAVKYVAEEEIGVLAAAGLTVLGENRAQELERKAARAGEGVVWHFIGQLQSRRVRQILPHAELIHSVASDSVVAQLRRHAPAGTTVLVEVDVAGEQAKAGVPVSEVPAFLERCAEVPAVRVAGLMTMPPLAASAEGSRPHFAALRELAERHGLEHLSMGTSQDFEVAVEEGATVVRVGSVLYRQ